MEIYTGLYTHPESSYDISWTPRGLKHLSKWARDQDYQLNVIKDIPWKRYYHFNNAWTFGTFVKFVALRHFTETYNEYFVWMDLDIYPTPSAYGYSIPRKTLLYAPLIDVQYCEHPDRSHMKRKLQWCGHTTDYLALSTGMFVLDRETAFSLWDWINKDYPINTPRWWADYYERQCSFDPAQPYNYGCDESIMEEWLNKTLPHFTQLTDDIHSVHAHLNPKFLHYYGQFKLNYPM